MPGKYGSDVGHKGMAGAYGMTGGKASYALKGSGGGKASTGGGPRNPLKGRSMERGPKDPAGSHRGNRGG
jgi:hypothetical protein